LFETPRRVNSVRGELGFTGSYRGMPVSVQATGMGRPSFSIYLHELITVYGARRVIRIGSCGSLDPSIGIRSLVIAQSAAMDFEIESMEDWRRPDGRLYQCAMRLARASGHAHHACPMVSSDVFYHPDPLGRFSGARERGARACDMETSATFDLVARAGIRGLSICTVVDSMITGEEIHSSELQRVFGPMAELALDTLLDDAEGVTA
jgi:purine-nucleoside phosphorylase